jgi:hypothetical protein
MATNTNGPFQTSENDWWFWVRPMPDGTYAVESYIDRIVLDGLTIEQARTLQVYLTELRNIYGNRDNVNAEIAAPIEMPCFLTQANVRRRITPGPKQESRERSNNDKD